MESVDLNELERYAHQEANIAANDDEIKELAQGLGIHVPHINREPHIRAVYNDDTLSRIAAEELINRLELHDLELRFREIKDRQKKSEDQLYEYIQQNADKLTGAVQKFGKEGLFDSLSEANSLSYTDDERINTRRSRKTA